jgi:glycosyltransferase involved in cell wall biosynthesis
MPNFLPGMPTSAKVATARAEICRRLHLPQKTRLVTGCGHIERVKGPDIFAEMGKHVLGRAPDPVAFVWLGRDADRWLARQVRSVAGTEVKFVGEVADPSIYFAASDVVVVPSRSESFSRVALEAGALGRPVLAFAAARGPADILSAECLVAELNAGAMATAVVELLGNPDFARRRGEELRERIAGHFLAEKWMPKLISLVEGEEGA